jgi:hypothetical protein
MPVRLGEEIQEVPRAIKKAPGGSGAGAFEGLSALGAFPALRQKNFAGRAVEAKTGVLYIRKEQADRAETIFVQAFVAGRVVVVQDQFGFLCGFFRNFLHSGLLLMQGTTER